MIEEQQDIITGDRLKAALESMLFVYTQPLTVQHAAKALGLDEIDVDVAMNELRLAYAGRGLQIIRIAGGFQMCTRPEYSEYISALLKPERTRLSRAALETVAIIAYRQPITQPEVDAIRGVNSDGVVRTLIEKNLVKQIGRKDTPGRPMLYATTEEFLSHFGLNDIAQLPELEDILLPQPNEEEPSTDCAESEPSTDEEQA
ncbi:MAG TPA: SMC-Scp complex subunit ScpB [Armatimonadota bacterium]|jgi:segregation and condensation protein B